LIHSKVGIHRLLYLKEIFNSNRHFCHELTTEQLEEIASQLENGTEKEALLKEYAYLIK
jgi:hypothetical protein